MKQMSSKFLSDKLNITLLALFILLTGISISTAIIMNKPDKETALNTEKMNQGSINNEEARRPSSGSATLSTDQQDMLIYLLEEEKLAHDVYTVMYQTYGSRIFANILVSEQTHQDRVLSLLTERDIADPRSDVLGKFTNPALQKLYDKLIAQGKQNLTEAYKVGIVIEQTDIADIESQLATATDGEITSTLSALERGSQNHLAAFTRQV